MLRDAASRPGLHSEIGDATLTDHGRRLYAKLEPFLSAPEPLADVVRAAKLDGERGPHRLCVTPPSREARELALRLVERSIPPLQQLVTWEWYRPRPDYPIKPCPEKLEEIDSRLLSAALDVGLPLLYLFSPVAFAEAKASSPVTHMPNVERRDELLSRLSIFIREEWFLWRLAGSLGGPSRAMPWAIRFAAIEWWWPLREKQVSPWGLCLRCGEARVNWRRPRGEPRCPACAKEPPPARVWPQSAIAPASRGRWLFPCRACGNAFESRRDAVWCPDHKPSRTTRSRRSRVVSL